MAKKKSQEVVHTDKLIKCRVAFTKQFFPKPPALIEEGKFGIIAVKVLDWDKGYEEPKAHPIYQTITVKGLMPEVIEGEYKEYFLQGWETTSDYGTSYTIQLMTEKHELKTREQQYKFLRAIITEKQTEALFEVFENPVEAILSGSIEDLTKVAGIGEKTAHKLMLKVVNAQDLSVIFTELDQYGLTQREVDELIMRFKNPKLIVDLMKKNPYILMDVVSRVGFNRADEVAMKAGFNPRSSKRVTAFIKHYLQEEAEAGNSWVNTQLLVSKIDEVFHENPVSNEAISKALKELAKKEMWYNEDKTKVGLRTIFELEQQIANELKRLALAPNRFKFEDWEVLIKQQEQRQGWEYTDEQKFGIKTILENNVTLIQGLAGCVDKDTEFFNGFEWKKMSDYEAGDKVLQFTTDRVAELVEPIKYIKQPQETLYHFKTKYGLDQCLSLEHDVVYETTKGKNLMKKPMKDVIAIHQQNVTGFNGKFLTTFDYSGKGMDLTDDEIRVMCAVICDGTFNKNDNSNWCIINLKKERKQERLETLLNQANIPYKVTVMENGYKRFRFYAPRREKAFTSEWYQCTQEQLRVVTGEILFWDGCTKDKRMSFHSNIKETADFVQFAFASTGFRATLHTYDRVGQSYLTHNKEYIRQSVEYTVSITNRTKVSMGGFEKNNPNKPKIEAYQTLDGFEYCFVVPSGMLVLRRNGRIFITGNCGKTATVAGMLAVFGDTYKTTACALSGRASTNIAESSSSNGVKIEGKTIHRLLQVKGEEGAFFFNETNPLDEDIIILDEVSMVNATLFYDLIKAIPTGSKLIMLGDSGQLESIGIGNIMFDIIHSDLIPSVSLTKVHRQASQSAIIADSIKVRNEQHLCDANEEKVEVRGELQDLVLDVYSDKEKTFTKIIHHFKQELKAIDNIMDLIVVLPTRERGKASVYHINNAIQEIIQPTLGFAKPYVVNEGKKNEFKIYEGDKVINNKNDYDVVNTNGEQTAIFNGNIGIVKRINHHTRQMVVDFDMIGEVLLEAENIMNLTLGYAITIHKCITEDTIIFTDKGMKILGDLNNQAEVGKRKRLKDVIHVHNGYDLEQASHFYNAGFSQTLKLKTNNWNEIEGTLDHRTLVLTKQDGLKNLTFARLNQGDILITSKSLNVYGHELKIPQPLRAIKRTKEDKTVTLPKKITPALSRFLGLTFITLLEQEAGTSSVYLKTNHKEVLDQYLADSKAVFNLEPMVYEEGSEWVAVINSPLVQAFCLGLFKSKTFTHHVVPSIVLQAPKEIQLAFLKGVFTQATIQQDNEEQVKQMVIKTNHKFVTKQLKMMCLNLGIYVSSEEAEGLGLDHEKVLAIGVRPASQLMKKVGVIGLKNNQQLTSQFEKAELKNEEKKEQIWADCLEGKYEKDLTEISNHDLTILLEKFIPNVNQLLFQLVLENVHLLEPKQSKHLVKKLYQNVKKKWTSREEIEEVLRLLEGKDVLDITLYNQFKVLADNYLEVITTIEKSQANTYCLTLPTTHRFVQNGYLMSNCQGSGIKTVIMGLDYSAFTMLTKELVYTGITRAKKKCILVAENKALRKAIKTSNLKKKQTFLKALLNNEKL